MNNLSLYTTFLSLFLLISIGFSSCKRNEPVLEDDQEEYDAVEVLFTLVNNPEKNVKVVFNRFGYPDQKNYQLLKDEKYQMEISLFHNGENINPEVEEESSEHQFFFFAPEKAVKDYHYQDDQLGLKGTISFGDLTEHFELKILLRHGLNKDHPAAQLWNNPNYAEAGGVDDLLFNIPISLH